MIGLYKYKLKWEDETSNIAEGFVFGETYSDAVRELAKMYGDLNLAKLYIKCVGCPDCFVLEIKENGKVRTEWSF